MATFTTTQSRNVNVNASTTTFTFGKVFDFLFAVNLREELDAKTSGDKSDAAYTCGL